MKLKIETIYVVLLIILFLAGFVMLLNGYFQITETEHTTIPVSSFEDCPNLLIRDGGKLFFYNTTPKTNKSNDNYENGVGGGVGGGVGANSIERDGSTSNPIIFNNLDEYIIYMEEQEKKGNSYHILFLQKECDVQNKDVYRIRESPFCTEEGGLPSVYISNYQSFLPFHQHDNNKNHFYEGFTNDDNDISLNTINKEDKPTNNVIPSIPTTPPIPTATQTTSSTADTSITNANMYTGFDPHGLYVGKFTSVDEIHNSTNTPKGSVNPADNNWLGVIETQKAVDSGAFVENEIYKPYQYQNMQLFK
jgi:hypothetical protein